MSSSSGTPDWIDETIPPPGHMPAITKIEHGITSIFWNVDAEISKGARGRIIKKMPGGMSDVYILRAFSSAFTFAVKTLKANAFKSQRALDGIISEAECWISLGKHTNIVQAHMVFLIRKKPVIWLEYVDGGDLSQHIGELTIPEILDYAIQFCNGMDYAHKRIGIVHGDIKPSNILLSSDKKTLKITDFGISHFIGGKGDKTDLQVVASQPRGDTPLSYKAPERFPLATQQKHGYCTPKMGVTTCSDIFSFGVTFYRVLTGSRPFQTEDEIFCCPPRHITTPRLETPKALESLIMRCLEKDPASRYQSFGELMQELIEIYNSLPKEQKPFGEKYTIRTGKEQDNGFALYSMGVMLGIMKRYVEANGFLERYLVINPKSADALGEMGLNHMDLREWKRAKQCYRQVLAIEPKDAEAWYDKGACHANLKEWKQAKHCFDQAVVIKPKYAEAWAYKGACHAYFGDWKQAKHCCDQAVDIKPKYFGAWYLKGASHGKLEEWKQAKQCCDQLVTIKPKDAEAWAYKGACHAYLKEWKQAKHCFGQAVVIKPKYAEAWRYKGVCYGELAQWKQAKQCFGQALEIFPGYAEAWYEKGMCNIYLCDYGEAKDCFMEFVRIAPPEMADYIKIAKDYIQQLSKSS